MGYFGHGEKHWHQQPLCTLKARAGTYTTMHFRLERASRSGSVFTAGDLGSEISAISIICVVDSYV